VAAAVINSNPYRPAGAKAVKPADLMPHFIPKPPETREQVAARIKARMRSWAAVQEAEVKHQADLEERRKRSV
jgi:hypothetical protein